MKDKKISMGSLASAVGVAAYVAVISYVMRNGEKVFGQVNNFLGPIAFLLMFVLSATITGALVLGRPAMLFLDGQKKEAVKLFLFSAGWLLVIIVAVFIAQILR